MASTAAVAAGAVAASTATMATIAAVTMAVTAGAGGAATYAGVATANSRAATTGDPLATVQSNLNICNPQNAATAKGRIKISFRTDELPTKTKFQQLFQTAYNKVSPGCDELYERQVLSSQLEEVALRGDPFGIDTYWNAMVSCYPTCPYEPLFGITMDGADGQNSIASVGHNFTDRIRQRTLQRRKLQEDGAITANKVPIDIYDFFWELGIGIQNQNGIAPDANDIVYAETFIIDDDDGNEYDRFNEYVLWR